MKKTDQVRHTVEDIRMVPLLDGKVSVVGILEDGTLGVHITAIQQRFNDEVHLHITSAGRYISPPQIEVDSIKGSRNLANDTDRVYVTNVKILKGGRPQHVDGVSGMVIGVKRALQAIEDHTLAW